MMGAKHAPGKKAKKTAPGLGNNMGPGTPPPVYPDIPDSTTNHSSPIVALMTMNEKQPKGSTRAHEHEHEHEHTRAHTSTHTHTLT